MHRSTVELSLYLVFFFKQKTAYEMRISDWSSDVCSSDLGDSRDKRMEAASGLQVGDLVYIPGHVMMVIGHDNGMPYVIHDTNGGSWLGPDGTLVRGRLNGVSVTPLTPLRFNATQTYVRSEEHTSELQSLMRISYAVFCLKKKKKQPTKRTEQHNQRRLHTTQEKKNKPKYSPKKYKLRHKTRITSEQPRKKTTRTQTNLTPSKTQYDTLDKQ